MKRAATTARQDPFVAHCVELLAPLGHVRTRRMFGGHGIYVDELFIALIAFERLYLKADAESAPRYAAAGCTQFSVEMKGKPATMAYWTAPDAAMDAPHEMLPWARLAMQAALAARAGKAPRPRALSAPARPKQAATDAPPAQKAAATRRRRG